MNAVLFSYVARLRRMVQVEKLSIERRIGGLRELDVYDPGGTERLSDDTLGQAMHLHGSRNQSECGFDPGPDTQHLAGSNQDPGADSGIGGILHPEDKHASWRQHPYEFGQICERKTPGHVLEDNVAVDERETSSEKWQMQTGVCQILAVFILIEGIGLLNHLLRNVESDTRGETPRQRLCKPADAASKI